MSTFSRPTLHSVLHSPLHERANICTHYRRTNRSNIQTSRSRLKGFQTRDRGYRGKLPKYANSPFLFSFSSFPTKNITRAKSHLELYAEKVVVAAERKDNTGPERALVRDTFRGRRAGNKDPRLNSTIKQKDTKPKLIVWLKSEKKKTP